MQLFGLRFGLGVVAVAAGTALILFSTVRGAFALTAAAPLAALVLGIVTALLGSHLVRDALDARRAYALRRARLRRRILSEVRPIVR